MKRRHLIQVGLGTVAGAIAIGTHGFAFSNITRSSNPKRLIVVFLRGAVDGLNVVVPYTETAYYEARPTIAIPKPGQPNGALDLDGRFGLHPALSSLMPLWQQKTLAFVHACGSPDPSRSHFEAQSYMETGTPGDHKISDGWMNRLLAALPNQDPLKGVAVGAVIPQILSGHMPVANLPSGAGATRPMAIDQPNIAAAFDRLYSDSSPLKQTFQEGQAARRILLSRLQPQQDAEQRIANRGAPLPSEAFAVDARRLGRLMVNEPRVQLAFMALGGWDTHIDQGGSSGELATRLHYLGQGLAALADSLQPIYHDTAIVVLSEFGRTLRENGNAGTDHGHGNALWLMGGSIRGGQIIGDWPGLTEDRLHEGRDLAITTDFREPLMAILGTHLNLETSNLHSVFPNFSPSLQPSAYLT